MKHNFNHPISYDTERLPVNREARHMMSKQPQLDLSDPNAAEALALCEVLRGAHVFARGVSAMDAASLICHLLKKREVVQNTWSPEVVAIKRRELELKTAQINAAKESVKAKKAHLLMVRQDQAELTQCFKEAAKAALSESDYSAIWDLANELRNARLIALQKGDMTP